MPGRRLAAAIGVLALSAGAGALPLAAMRGAEQAPMLAEPDRSAAAGLIPLQGEEGRGLLFGSEAHAAFLPLVSHFETQLSLTHCGLATIAMVLNALAVPAPESDRHAPYRLFTQQSVLNGLTDAITDDRRVARRGMTLEELEKVLDVYEVAAEAHHAGETSVDRFREEAVEHLDREGRHVIVNYSRAALGQEGGGHISPLAAYDADTDSFLILDVSRYKTPPVWAPTDRLFAAMAEPTEPGGDRTRGFVLVERL